MKYHAGNSQYGIFLSLCYYLPTNQPADDYISLALQLDNVADEVTMRMLDYNGRLIQTREERDVQKDNFEFNVSSLPSGTYFISVETPEGFRAKSFIVAH